MKRKIIFICSILFVLLAGFNASAKIFNDDVTDYISSEPLTEEVKFNVLRGVSKNEFNESTYYYQLEDFLIGYIVNGYIEVEGDVIGDNSLSAKLFGRYDITNTYDLKYTAKLNDDVIYQMHYNSTDSTYDVLVNKEVDLNRTIGYSPSGYALENFDVSCDGELPVNNGETQSPDLEEIGYVKFTSFHTLLYKYETKYLDQKVHFISNILNPLTEQQILSSIKVNDLTDGDDINYQILYSEYDYDNPNVGEYPITICTIDKSGNATLLDAYVNVVAVDAPKITPKDIRVTYRGFYREQDIKPYFKVKCNYDYTIEIIENNYKDNYTKPGDYTVTAKVTDIYGNYSTATLTVHVVDDAIPRIVYSKIQVTTLNPYTIDDFKKHINVYDEIDGAITDYTITDLDGYFETVKKPGDYRIRVDASDKAGNSTFSNIYFMVRDTDYPSITVDEYTIVASADHVITREEIIEILIKAGQISDDQNVLLVSDYFDVENPSGSYSLEVRTDDGVFYDKIEVSVSNDITPSIVKDNKKFNYLFVLIPSIIVVLGSLSFIVYKKKH